jgi:hypothetical protein
MEDLSFVKIRPLLLEQIANPAYLEGCDGGI